MSRSILGALIFILVGTMSITAARAETACGVISTFVSNIDVGITSVGGGSVEVFYVIPSENLVRATVDPRSVTVLASENLLGVARSEPSAASWGPGHSIVVVRGSDGALWYLQWINGIGTGWQSLGGQVVWNPYVVALGVGHLMVFYRGTNKELWYREFNNGSWGPHTSLSGVLTSSPIAVSWADNHVAVFSRGQANDLWYRERNGSTWGPWIGLGGSFATDPVAVSRGVGLIDVFVKSTFSGIFKISSNAGVWGAWVNLGSPPGGALSEPGAAVASTTGLTVFARGDTVFQGFHIRDIWQSTSTDGGSTWSAWSIGNGPFSPPSANNPEATGNAFGGWTVAGINFPSGARGGSLQICSTSF